MILDLHDLNKIINEFRINIFNTLSVLPKLFLLTYSNLFYRIEKKLIKKIREFVSEISQLIYIKRSVKEI